MTQLMAYRGFALATAPASIKALVTAFIGMAALGVTVGFANYQVRTGLTAEGSAAWYRSGVAANPAAADADPASQGGAMPLYAKTPLELLDATHPHLFNQAFLFFVLGHLLALCSMKARWKVATYLAGYAGVAVDVASPWLIRYGGAGFAWLQMAGHLAMAAAFLVLVGVPLWTMWRPGRRAAAVLAVLGIVGAGCASGGARTGASPGASVRLDRAWPVMGTMLQATAVAADSGAARAALSAAHGEVVRVDSLMSTYRPESEVSRMNAAAGTGDWTDLSPATLEVLDAAIAWSGRTEGAFDPTIGPVVDLWGFHGGGGEVPPAARIDSVRAVTGCRRIEIERARAPYLGRGRARLPLPGMALDFGAIAKGYALDRAVAAMREAGAAGGMVDLGGQVSVFGAAPDGGRGWPIGIRDPRDPEAILGVVTLESGSLATSGDYERFFVHDGVRYSHVIDPRTGWPVRGVAQTTVIAPSGTDADALSTALFVLGPDEGRAVLEDVAPDATAVWVADPGEEAVGPADVIVAGARPDRVELER